MSKTRMVSSARVIQRVMRIMRFSGSDWLGDAYEYIGEAIGMIGTFAPLVKKGVCLTVKDHRAKLPCDLETLFFVEYEGKNLNRGGDFTGYDLPRSPRTTNIYSLTSSGNGDIIYLDGETATAETNLLQSDFGNYYLLNPDYIQTSFEEGEIKLHYAGYPIDQYGCPYIMDDAVYETALFWYVVYQLLLSGYEHPKLEWNVAEQRWEEHKLRAAARMKIPDMGEMERFKNMWVRLIPHTSLPQDFFAGSETTQFIAGI